MSNKLKRPVYDKPVVKKVLMKDGEVVNIIKCFDDYEPPENHVIMDWEDGVHIGATHDGERFVNPEPPLIDPMIEREQGIQALARKKLEEEYDALPETEKLKLKEKN